jgi:outer membrane protein TolC
MAVGETTSDEVSQAEASKLDAEEKLEELQILMIQTENELCALLGRYSSHIDRGNFQASCEHLPQISKIHIQALAAPPAIRKAEAALKSAFYATNKARAELYPSLTLSGSIGWTNDAGEVVNPAGMLTKALASLSAPIFNHGRLKAELRKAQAEQEEARIAFRQAILDAGKEVNDALASVQYARKTIGINEQQVEKLTSVVENSKLRMKYEEDFNYLQVLLARQSLLEARLALLGNRFMLLGSTIQLYKSLGGGN